MNSNIPGKSKLRYQRKMAADGKAKAQTMAELPLVLWVIIIVFTVPLVDLVAFSIRYNYLLMASRDAVYTASRAKTFLQNVSAQDLSAVNSARVQANTTAAAFPEVTVNSVNTSIVVTKLSDGTVTRTTTPLSTPADTSNYAYQLETTVNGTSNPLLQMYQGSGIAIPGLNAPISVSITSRAFSECPQGLNQ